MATWKRDAASGLVVVVPILVTVYAIYWLYSQVAGVPLLNGLTDPEKVAVLVTLLAATVLGVGYLMRTTVGTVVEGWIDDLANRLPVVRVLYNASKMAVETALTGTEELQTPVKLEPWDGIRMTAFKTGKQTNDGRDVLFLPTAPNITTGYVIEVESDSYEIVDERVEDALTRILSAGFGESRDVDIPIGTLLNEAEDSSPDEEDDETEAISSTGEEELTPPSDP